MNNKIFVLFFTIAVFLVGGLLYIFNPEPESYGEENAILCPQDVRLCPDGSYVARVAPDCQFAACTIPPDAIFEDGTLPDSTPENNNSGNKPEESEQVVCTMDAKLCPDGSYVGRTGPKCEFAPCPSETLCEGGTCPQ